MIRKKSDTGWWEGELQVRGKRKQIGWFPATYVKVKTSGRLSGRSTPVSGGKIQMNETILGKNKNRIIGNHFFEFIDFVYSETKIPLYFTF